MLQRSKRTVDFNSLSSDSCASSPVATTPSHSKRRRLTKETNEIFDLTDVWNTLHSETENFPNIAWDFDDDDESSNCSSAKCWPSGTNEKSCGTIYLKSPLDPCPYVNSQHTTKVKSPEYSSWTTLFNCYNFDYNVCPKGPAIQDKIFDHISLLYKLKQIQLNTQS
jgi:hypothetical protein